MKYLPVLSFIFLTTTLGLGAGVPPNSTTIDIQATTFKVTDPTFLLSMLNPSADGDEALFAQLVAMVKDGAAELVSDDHLSALPGKVAEVKATREQPFPNLSIMLYNPPISPPPPASASAPRNSSKSPPGTLKKAAGKSR